MNESIASNLTIGALCNRQSMGRNSTQGLPQKPNGSGGMRDRKKFQYFFREALDFDLLSTYLREGVDGHRLLFDNIAIRLKEEGGSLNDNSKERKSLQKERYACE
jgi:hypothetical protein